jgi:hypothetical protein
MHGSLEFFQRRDGVWIMEEITMNVLYKSTRGDLPCFIIQKDDSYFCTIGEQQNMINNSFTEDEKSLDFLFDCIIDAFYLKYLAEKELEAVSFD